jgi:hypothetical protein
MQKAKGQESRAAALLPGPKPDPGEVEGASVVKNASPGD